MSSMKLTPATRVTAIRNQMLWKPKKAAHIHSPSTKMIPPPRSTMLLCEERWLGLSMMLIHQFGCKKQGRDYQICKPSSHISVYLCCEEQNMSLLK